MWEEHRVRRRNIKYASTREWSADFADIGTDGEEALALYGGGIPDGRNKPGGDKGVDILWFMTITGKFEWIKLDAKAARGPKELLVDVKKCRPDCIYVFAAHRGRRKAELLAWEWGHEMQKCPTEYWSGNQALVYHKPRGLLRPLSELQHYYCGRWKWFDDQDAPLRGYPAEYTVIRPPKIKNPFQGWCCKCRGDGLYWFANNWYCNEHRVW